MSSVAVITIAHGRHRHLGRQQQSLARSGTPPDPWVLVAMDDPGLLRWPGLPTPEAVAVPVGAEGLPLAAARNAGARAALERGADVLVFLDVDCLLAPQALAGYAEAVSGNPLTIWSGPVTYLPEGLSDEQLRRPWELDSPHPGRPAPAPGESMTGADPRLFWSLSFALSAQAWKLVGGFCEEYVGYGGEDTDFAMLAVAAGLDLGWIGRARAYHQHHPTSRPPVQHAASIVRNARIFHARWGWWPMLDWLEELAQLGLTRKVADDWQHCDARSPAHPTHRQALG